jgi:hypothetical protein
MERCPAALVPKGLLDAYTERERATVAATASAGGEQ